MRLEQLVLFGPSDNFCIQFGPRVTVIAGLATDERTSMLTTLVDAMAGRVPNASVIFIDQAGRRVYADRIGATYADNGVAAPSLSQLLGSDPTVIADLVTLREEDLGLGEHRTEESIEADLISARAAVEQLEAEHREVTTYVIEIETWQQHLAELDDEIQRTPDEIDRWEWIGLRNQLDELRAELASLDRPEDVDAEAADARLLAAVEDLRTTGEAWAEASTAATELGVQVGPLPPVSDADLARVAATPDALPVDLDDRVATLEAAVEIHRVCVDAIKAADQQPADPADGIVYELAQLDQDRLWQAHAAAVKAQSLYEAELESHADDTDPEVESEIEVAHHEVVRCQREVERRFRPGILGASTLAVAALLAGQAISVIVGAILLIGAVAMGVWLLVIPRKELAAAEHAEAQALTHADAGSWLGLHLRRIDDVMQPTDRKGLSAALDLRSSTRLDWEEISSRTSLEAATERKDAILAYADAIDPKARAAREQVARDALAASMSQEVAARHELTRGLDGFGLPDDGAFDLAPSQIRGVLEQRASAGRYARQVVELQELTAVATTAGIDLDALLCRLGFDDGDLAGRLDRAIVSVESARRRRLAATDSRGRDDLEAEIARLSDEVGARRRLSWDLTPDPTEAPQDLAALKDRRRLLAEQIASERMPDLGDVDRRTGVAAERVRMLEGELATLSDGPAAVRRRLADRIARTTWIGPNEEALPLIIDDALVGVDPSELFKLLDMVVRLSTRTQVVLLTSDATIAKWARREAENGIITVFETDGAATL
ncbi:hypothetical protein [Aquihabitans sp. McL0605]|uniref:hypothetical protein n=1 Tax=Aquihabitans sp. McL0605 TaxID=3415671 RepID=UPI003CE8CBA6